MARAVTLLFLWLMASLAAPQASPTAKVAIGDVLFVSVIGYPEFTSQMVVATDGTISGPGFGRMVADGRSLGELKTQITTKLRDYVRDPQVNVTFVQQSSAFIYIVGAGLGGGPVPYREGIDIRALLTGIALPRSSDLYEGIVYRNGNEVARFNVRDLLRNESGVWQGPVMPRDTIVITPISMIKVWFLNDFGKNGEMELVEGTSLAQGVAAAGGALIRPDATQPLPLAIEDKYRVVVVRGGERFAFRVKNDPTSEGFRLRAGDTVSLERPSLANVMVLGNVMQPRQSTVLTGDDITVPLFSASGIAPTGTLDGVLVFRKGIVHRLDLTGTLRGEERTPFPVEDGDIVFVPKNERFVYVLGETLRAGRLVMPDNQDWRAADALAEAGGLNPNGSLRRAILLRVDEKGVHQKLEFNLDEFIKNGKLESNPVLQPGDVLFFNKPRNAFSLSEITQIVSSFFLIDSILKR